ncbi:transcription factor TFIIIB component B'' homolog [Rhinoderma darwinii]|uniref:transcription factor TFIIIB component B'' homolog n=1 Tax=Rhinoderma darwinii TaxID=43563 RepID=UPI003F66301B
MIRRARLSFKPNVRPGGRAAGQGTVSSGRDGGAAPSAEPDPGKDNKTAGPGESASPVTGDPVDPQENKAEPIETAATVGNETPSKTVSAPLQRRKRISTLPNLAKPRLSNSAPPVIPPPTPPQVDVPLTLPINIASCNKNEESSTEKGKVLSPQKSQVPLNISSCNKNEGSSTEKGKVLSPQKSQVPLSLPQEQHVTLPEKRTPVPQVPQFSPYKKSVLKHQEVSPAKPVEELSPLKERPSQKSCSNELFEAIKKITPNKVITSNLEKERLRRAQKLRELLKNELRKERNAWKAKHPVINTMVEPEKSTMIIRDFVHFIPMSNPMSSSLEESQSIEKPSPVETPATGLGGKNSAEEDNHEDDDDDDEEDDSQLLAPRVKVAEDGSIILDEESLTVEVSRIKAPIVEGNDPIFERGSTTTYSSFRKNTYSKPWSDQETDMFFLAISMVGTDFSMIGQLFPHRERIEIKNKFKKEERVNGWRIDKAFREKKDFDFEFFAQLLENALEAGKKKKTRNKRPRKTTTKSRKKKKEKSAEQSLCDDESVISEEEGARTAEKENKRSLDVDECSGVADPAKKKRARRKKENAREAEGENHESQDDDLSQMPKKKSRKSKTAERDADNRLEPQSVESDGSLKDTPPEKKTRVQKNQPIYKESEMEDDENDDGDITENAARVSCNAGEADLSCQSVALPCEEETSLVLFTEESDYQSGIDDLSSMHVSLSEGNEAVSDVSLVAPNFMLGETEPMDVAQEETSSSACDKSDLFDKALDVGSGQPDEKGSDSMDKQKASQGHRAPPAPNLSRTSEKMSTEDQSDIGHQADLRNDTDDVRKSVDKKILLEECLTVDQPRQTGEIANAEDLSTPHNGQMESSVKPVLLRKGRLQRPKPNLPVRTSTRTEKLDETKATDVHMEGTVKCTDVSDVLTQNQKEDTGNKEEIEVSSIDKDILDNSFNVQVFSSVKLDSESGLSQKEDTNTVQEECHKGDISKAKSSLPVRGRSRPKPNLTRAQAKNKSSDTEQESQHSKVAHVGTKPPSQKPGRDQENEVKQRAESSSGSQDECRKSPIKPAPLARGRFQTPKPSLIKASSKKEAFNDQEDSSVSLSAGHAEEDTDRDIQSDNISGKQEKESSVNTGSESSQDCCKSESLHRPSLTQDSTANHDRLTEPPSISETQSSKSPIKPAPLARGRLQKPKPNLVRVTGRKEKLKESESVEAVSEADEKRSASDHLNLPCVEHVSHVNTKPPSHKPGRDQENEVKERAESSSGSQEDCRKSPIKPALLARGRFQTPKPSLIKASSKKEAFNGQEDSSVSLSAGHAEEDTDRDVQSDNVSGKQEKESSVNTRSESSQDCCKSESLNRPSLTQDSTANHDHLTEPPSISETQSSKSPIKPAPLARGRLQKPKPNLVKATGQKEELKESESVEAVSEAIEKRSVSDHLRSSFVEHPTELAIKVPSVEKHVQDECNSEKPDSMLPLKVDRENLAEEPNTPLKPAVLPKGRFRKPKPNLGRAAVQVGLISQDEPMSKAETCAESTLESKDATSNMPVCEAETTHLLAKSNEGSSVPEEDSVTMERPDNGGSCEASVDSTPAMTNKERSASDDETKTLKSVITRGRFQRPKPNLNKAAPRSVACAPLMSDVQKEEERTGSTSTDDNDPKMSLDVDTLSIGDAGNESSTVEDTCDRAVVTVLAQVEEATNDAGHGETPSLKPLRTRFQKPSPNLGRSAVRKMTSTKEPKTLVPEKGQETLKVIGKNPELLKNEDMSDTPIAGLGCEKAGHAIEEKSTAIKPAQLKRGRLLRPVPNLVKPCIKTLSPIQSKTNDLQDAPMLKMDKDHVVATSSPAIKRKASDCHVDLCPKRICHPDVPQKPICLSDVEGGQSSSQSSSVQGDSTPQRPRRFGKPLRKLSTAASVSPKSENSLDRLEKKKSVHNVKPNTVKVSNSVSSKSKGKTTLVKIRATQQEEDEEEDADLGIEEESYDLAPDMQNQAPVFVPFSLRSPKPVPAEIEETMEELEIPVDAVYLPNSTNQDLGRTPFQHVVVLQSQPDKKGEFPSPDQCTENQLSSSARQDNREISTSNLENKTQTRGITSDFRPAEDLSNTINDNLAFPAEQIGYPVMQGEAQQQDFSSQDVTVSDCLLGEHDHGEEDTFILTLVEIPINDDYAYSCNSNTAESLPAPVLISSGSSQVRTQNLNPSVETVSNEPCTVGQEDKELILSARSSRCIDEDDHTPLQNKSLVSEQVDDPENIATDVEADGDRKVASEVSVTEPKTEEPAGISQISATAVRERPTSWPAAAASGPVPMDMPGISTTDSLNRNRLPLVYANPVTTSKTTLKRPGKKPLGFLPLICKEKQPKETSEENQKKKNLPKPKCRNISPRVHDQTKESLDLSLENANDFEVPSSSLVFSPTEKQNAEIAEAFPSTSQILDSPDTELNTPSKSHDLATEEEEAAPVSEYFFSDIFMEVDD